jgi:hypothetical protein
MPGDGAGEVGGVNKWRRIEKRKEGRTFRARQRVVKAVRVSTAAAAAMAGLAQINLIRATAAPGAHKSAAITEAVKATENSVRARLRQWPNWGF